MKKGENRHEGAARTKSHLSPRMGRSSSFHKRRCYFTPQDLSSMWHHCPQQGQANQDPSFRQHSPSLPHLTQQHRAKHPCSLLKRQHTIFYVQVVTNGKCFHQRHMMMTPAGKCVITSCRKDLCWCKNWRHDIMSYLASLSLSFLLCLDLMLSFLYITIFSSLSCSSCFVSLAFALNYDSSIWSLRICVAIKNKFKGKNITFSTMTCMHNVIARLFYNTI